MTSIETIENNDTFAGLEDDWESASRYLSMFIDEAEHTIDELIEALLALEAGGGRENVEQLFIAAHRIKGSAATIGLCRVAKLAHLMEDLLQLIVDSGCMLTSSIADAILAGTDGLRSYIESLKAGRPEDRDFNALAKQIMAAHASFASSLAEADAPPDDATASNEKAASPQACDTQQTQRPTDEGITPELRRHVADAMREEQRDSAMVGKVFFMPNLPQVGLKARLIYEKLLHLGDICHFDPPADDIEMREQLDSITFGVVTDKSADAIQRQIRIAGIAGIAIEPLCVKSQTNAADGTEAVRAKSQEHALKPAETVRVDIERLDQLMNLAGQLAISKSRISQLVDSLKNIVCNGSSSRAIDGVAAELEKMAVSLTSSTSENTLRADMEHFRNTARHLHCEMENVRREVESLGAVRSCVSDLLETIHLLDRVSDGIHQSVMNTRMLPIGPLFARFHRVIRDITRSNGKEIRLTINGEKTELDKRMIDELGDPMIHMIRNAADHGIESPDEREAAGKPRQGTITLDAFHRGSNIIIRVSDDGRGLDYERIRDKAIEKGLISAADAERMTRQQIFQLIWLPGLSTAEKVTEVSGRGVGMDIVRSQIEELNGAIDIDSEPGRGTTITIKLPLTLAILPSLMVEIDRDVFALPLESVVEIVDVQPQDITTVQGQPIAMIRDQVISVLRLGRLFQWQCAEREGNVTLVVIGEGGRQIGLAVDRVLGEEDIVIKSIADNYHNVHGIAGASILGDGRVSLILDSPSLIEMSSSNAAMALS